MSFDIFGDALDELFDEDENDEAASDENQDHSESPISFYSVDKKGNIERQPDMSIEDLGETWETMFYKSQTLMEELLEYSERKLKEGETSLSKLAAQLEFLKVENARLLKNNNVLRKVIKEKENA